MIECYRPEGLSRLDISGIGKAVFDKETRTSSKPLRYQGFYYPLFTSMDIRLLTITTRKKFAPIYSIEWNPKNRNTAERNKKINRLEQRPLMIINPFSQPAGDLSAFIPSSLRTLDRFTPLSDIKHNTHCGFVPLNIILNGTAHPASDVVGLFGDKLIQDKKRRIDNKVGLNTYAGKRLKFGYPARGQRTQSNAKTSRRRRAL